jgi:Fur family transcriptional regulator, ferric uptake regulator
VKKRLHQHCPEAPDLTERLRAESRKITGPRLAILRLLEREAHPLTVREIHELLPRLECDLATIYRSMHMLERLKMVQRFDFGDGTARFELIRTETNAHHHHLICTGCAKIVEIEECFVLELEKKIAQGSGFTEICHKLEFFGMCPSCQPE